MTSPDGPEEDREAVEVVREAVTMALYISLSLLAVLTALPTSMEAAAPNVALTVGLTAIGLVLAHQVAFRMSTRLVSHGRIDPGASRLLGAQLLGGAAVTVVAVLPLVVFGSDAMPVSFALLLSFVGVVGYVAARSVPMSRAKALGYVAMVVVVVAGVLAVKSLVGH